MLAPFFSKQNLYHLDILLLFLVFRLISLPILVFTVLPVPDHLTHQMITFFGLFLPLLVFGSVPLPVLVPALLPVPAAPSLLLLLQSCATISNH